MSFVDTELASDLNAVNKQRKSHLKMFVIATVVCVLFVVFVSYGSVVFDMSFLQDANYIIYFFLGFAALYAVMLSIFYMRRKKQGATPTTASGYGFKYDFKDKVVRRMVEFLDPSFKYQINNYIKLTEIMSSGMMQEQKYIISGSDMVQGEEDGVPFKFSDVQIGREKTFVGKNEDPIEGIFAGSFFIAEFNKTFKSPVYVYAKKTFGGLSNLSYTGDKVRLEDPDFDKQFTVYSPDQIEARFILTTSMMERIKALRSRMGSNVYIVFANNNIYIANNNNKDRFEIGMTSSVNSRENIIGYYKDLVDQLGIIDELKLNIKIWKA